ncbi:MAG TPA: ribosome biogenesis GTP-binding protein YihA/YsxC [Chitinispirillaceae bacterium]|nr:ribosome biogenesis GTP-binding protein YihA/YsxC [Chitinispirillaceae bacterium]
MENNETKRPEAVFISSSAHFRELPAPQGEEFAIMGRSNVGKSSFINHVLENRGLARVSKKPGKTTLANYYRIDNEMIWVDLPGYGYAKAPGVERLRWSRLISDYCERRTNLNGLIWLIDCRHIGTKADLEASEWFRKLKLPLFMVLTKVDKITRGKQNEAIRQAMTVFGIPEEPILYSTLEHQSRQRFWERFNIWRGRLKQEQ